MLLILGAAGSCPGYLPPGLFWSWTHVLMHKLAYLYGANTGPTVLAVWDRWWFPSYSAEQHFIYLITNLLLRAWTGKAWLGSLKCWTRCRNTQLCHWTTARDIPTLFHTHLDPLVANSSKGQNPAVGSRFPSPVLGVIFSLLGIKLNNLLAYLLQACKHVTGICPSTSKRLFSHICMHISFPFNFLSI